MSCHNPWGETQDWVINWARYGINAHAKETELRRSVKAIIAVLESQEWAEHISDDKDIQQLEQQITRLIGKLPNVRGNWTATPAAKPPSEVAGPCWPTS